MTEQEWTAFKAKIAGHTKGPWDCTGCMFPEDDMGGVYYRIQAEAISANAANAALIAAAPTLVAEVERLRDREAQLAKAVKTARHTFLWYGNLHARPDDPAAVRNFELAEAMEAALTGSSQ